MPVGRAKRWKDAMIRKLVPHGTKAIVVEPGAKRKRENRRSDAERLASEPWRKSGYNHAYRSARQLVIERQRGRCAITGKVVAEKRDGTWRITEPGAGVHHKVALSEGGTEDPSNLVLLSASAHALVDSRRRKSR